jgi:hypothetical protein
MKIFGKKVHGVKHFGRKTSNAFNHFGKKVSQIAPKVVHQLDLIERKAVNSLDKATPFLAIGSNAIIPGSGEGITKFNDAVQTGHKDLRSAIKSGSNLYKTHRNDPSSTTNQIQFGDDVDKSKASLNKISELLRK